MATPAVDPIDAFFTSERLAYYRDLHAQYPLWCGDWPEDLCREPEYVRHWAGSQQIHDSLTEAAGGREVLALLDNEGSEAQTALVWSEGAPEAVLVVFEARFVTLQRAVVETFHISSKQSEPFDSLSRDLISGLEFLFDPRAFQARHGEIPVGKPEPLNGWYFWRLHRKLELATVDGSDRGKILKKIQNYWVNIGKEIGAIPRLPVGGSQCLLPDNFLGQLKSEGEDLIREIRDHEPMESDLASIAERIEPKQPSISLVQMEYLAFLRRQGKHDEANSLSKPGEERPGEFPPGAREWAVRLRFPMLTCTELELVTDERERAGLGVAEVVLDLMAARLPISASTIANRTSGISGQ